MTPQNLYDGCAILRREDLPYCIFEADEIFGGEPSKPDKQMLVSKELIGRGYGKFDQIYRLFENEEYVGFYVPENYLDYRKEQRSEAEQMLVDFLSELEVTGPSPLTLDDKRKTIGDTGRKLKSFSFKEEDLSALVDRDSEIFGQVRGNIARHAFALEEDLKEYTAAQRLVYALKYEIRMGDIPFTDIIQDLLQHLSVLGVELTDDEYSTLFELTHDTISQIHLWCRCGWQAESLSRRAHYYS